MRGEVGAEVDLNRLAREAPFLRPLFLEHTLRQNGVYTTHP